MVTDIELILAILSNCFSLALGFMGRYTSFTTIAATAVINVSTVDISAAVMVAKIKPNTPGRLKKSDAIKNASSA